MKYFWPIYLLIVATTLAFSQPPVPQLSTADKVAIQTLEKAKADARKQFDDANQSELAILREWQATHVGYHVNQQTFAVEPDPQPKTEAPKEKK